ncbi:MAG: hypothetical protein HQ510_06170 [Candidatus Marinimicrobia bacterium]|nr:hypothetical protein [Candidatus Neomarinimicrobiota bacterium]
MSRTYTPGLKVLHNTTVRKVRQLPLRGKVNLAIGDIVKPDRVVASTHIPGNVHMVNAAILMNVEPDAVPECMLVKIDAPISKGQIIAQSKGFFGLFKSHIKSQIDGTLGNVSGITGQIILNEPPIPIEVDAYTSGKVVEVIPEEGVVIETSAAIIQGILGIAGESHGDIEVLTKNASDELTEDMILDSHAGKIIVGGSFISLDTYKKAIRKKVAAVVVGGFNYSDITTLLGYPLGVAITGSEDIGTTLVITEGFGKISMADRTYSLLSEHNGDFAAITGATQIRAGVIRPEVLIPFPDSSDHGMVFDETGVATTEGSIVRVIRAPHFGRVGKVKSLPPQLMKMESETMVRVAEIEFEDGTVNTIPRANLEMILTD